MTTVEPIIIIGSGLAGYSLAREIRKLDQECPLTIVTADDGRYYSKPQLSSALSHQKTAASLGLMNAERMANQLKATIINNTWVTGINHATQEITAGDKVLKYSKLVLACGASPIKVPFAGNAGDTLYTVNNLQDYEHFRDGIVDKKHIAIIGAGLVGCEFANDLINGGYKVSVIALSETPLNLLLPPIAGHAVKQGLEQAGVDWHLNCSVTKIDKAGSHYSLTLSNGEQISVDVVLSAIGLKPATNIAATTGITVERGIVVNRFLETSVPNIYALGDCAEIAGRVMLYVMPLVIGARALAATLTGNNTMVNYPAMPVIIKTSACPVVVQPPMQTTEGDWKISGEGVDIKALFYDKHQQLQGFALTGSKVDEKLPLIELLPKTLF